MTSKSLSHLSDYTLLRAFAASLKRDCATTATIVAYLGEIDLRKLYAPAGYPSLFLYCVHEHGMSEDMAYKRIQAARAARRFSALLPALADGRLHLTAVVLLAPHLNSDNADELIAAATHRTKAQVELLLAERFPKPDLPTLIRAIAAPAASDAPAVGQVMPSGGSGSPGRMAQLVPEPVVASVESNAPTCVGPVSFHAASRTRVAPSSPGRFTLQLTMGQTTHDLLRYAQSLLGHTVPSGDVEAVLQRALREMVERLEKQKFAAAVRPRPQRGSTSSRHIPAEVQRAVWKRDGGRCTFVSDKGRRCEERTRVEYDHVQPVARGGGATTENLRLRCRAHNHYAAESAFGAEFMRRKLEEARDRTERSPHEVSASV